MAFIALMLGGFIGVGIISRLLLLFVKSWQARYAPLIAVNAVSFLIAVLLAGIGTADGGPFVPLQAAATYAIPQLIWLGIDLYRAKTGKSRVPLNSN